MKAVKANHRVTGLAHGSEGQARQAEERGMMMRRRNRDRRTLRRLIGDMLERDGLAGLMDCVAALSRSCAFEAAEVQSDRGPGPIFQHAQEQLAVLWRDIEERGLQSGEIMPPDDDDDDPEISS
jgi:hypothetical protein